LWGLWSGSILPAVDIAIGAPPVLIFTSRPMPGKKLSTQDLDHFSAQLRMMLTALEGDIDHLQAGTLGPDARPETQGDEGEGYAAEFSLELLQHDEETLTGVRDAIRRIEGGAYGRCEACGQWLVKDRLRAMPHARRCIACQRQAEAESF
jgi:DnaK suppressor protein